MAVGRVVVPCGVVPVAPLVTVVAVVLSVVVPVVRLVVAVVVPGVAMVPGGLAGRGRHHRDGDVSPT